MPRPQDATGTNALYQNPFRNADVSVGRLDQGLDLTGSGPIHALGPGVIEQTLNSGWPGGAFIAERMTDGPLKGQYVYVAEDVNPVVHPGDHVDANTVIGYFAPRGGSIETGFAAPPPNLGQALAYVKGQSCYAALPGKKYDPGCHPTAEGRRYASLLKSLGGPAPGGVSAHFPGSAGTASETTSPDPGCLVGFGLPGLSLPGLGSVGGGGRVCLLRKSQARAVIGGTLIAVGGVAGIVGLAVLMGAAFQRSTNVLGKAADATAVVPLPGAQAASAGLRRASAVPAKRKEKAQARARKKPAKGKAKKKGP